MSQGKPNWTNRTMWTGDNLGHHARYELRQR